MEDREIEVSDLAPENDLPEDAAPEDPETDTGDAAVEDMPEDPGSDEGSESVSEEEAISEEESETEEAASEEEPDPEESEETGYEDPAALPAETISGNDIVTISGNAVIFPEDFDLSLLGGSTESSTGDSDAIIKAIEAQNDLFYGISAVMVFLLGVIAGILLIHGFRLRRT